MPPPVNASLFRFVHLSQNRPQRIDQIGLFPTEPAISLRIAPEMAIGGGAGRSGG